MRSMLSRRRALLAAFVALAACKPQPDLDATAKELATPMRPALLLLTVHGGFQSCAYGETPSLVASPDINARPYLQHLAPMLEQLAAKGTQTIVLSTCYEKQFLGLTNEDKLWSALAAYPPELLAPLLALPEVKALAPSTSPAVKGGFATAAALGDARFALQTSLAQLATTTQRRLVTVTFGVSHGGWLALRSTRAVAARADVAKALTQQPCAGDGAPTPFCLDRLFTVDPISRKDCNSTAITLKAPGCRRPPGPPSEPELAADQLAAVVARQLNVFQLDFDPLHSGPRGPLAGPLAARVADVRCAYEHREGFSKILGDAHWAVSEDQAVWDMVRGQILELVGAPTELAGAFVGPQAAPLDAVPSTIGSTPKGRCEPYVAPAGPG
jgi:hypothetical protein